MVGNEFTIYILILKYFYLGLNIGNHGMGIMLVGYCRSANKSLPTSINL